VINHPPGNDAFARAIRLKGREQISWQGHNVLATMESAEPVHAGNRGERSVWFSLVPQTTTEVTIDTFGSAIDTLLAVYTGPDLARLTPVAANDDANWGTYQSRITAKLQGGQVYHVAVDGYGGETGFLSVQVGGDGLVARSAFSWQLFLPVLLQPVTAR
jgi:creatinine amidohydrolase/Fe(II)-dependent formamide hydrolase-like protein